MKAYLFCRLVLVFLLLGGCSSAQFPSDYTELDVRGFVDPPIFLVSPSSKQLYLEIDCSVPNWPDISKMRGAFEDKGYILTEDKQDADILLLVTVQAGGKEYYSTYRGGVNKNKHKPSVDGMGPDLAVGTSLTGNPISALVGVVGAIGIWAVLPASGTDTYFIAQDVSGEITVLEKKNSKKIVKDWWEKYPSKNQSSSKIVIRARHLDLMWDDAAPKIEEELCSRIVAALPQRN